MGFFDNEIGKVDKRGLLNEVLQQNKYSDLGAYDKAKLIMSHASRGWEDIGDLLYTNDSERYSDSKFQAELANTDNLDLIGKHQISINDIPLLRSTKNQDDFNQTLEEIKQRQEEDFKLSGATKGALWTGLNFGASVVADPLFLPTLAVPSLGVTRYGKMLGGLADTTYGAGLSYGLNSLEELATKKDKDLGSVVQDMLINGFLFGAIGAYNAKSPLTHTKVREHRNNLLDWTNRHLLEYKDKNSVILSYATGKPVQWKGALVKHTDDIAGAYKRFNVTQSDIRAMLKDRGVSTSISDEIHKIYTSKNPKEILQNEEHPLMQSIRAKLENEQPFRQPNKRGLNYMPNKPRYQTPHQIDLEVMSNHPLFGLALHRGEALNVARDGTKVELPDSKYLTPQMVKRLREDRPKKQDVVNLQKELDYLDSDPKYKNFVNPSIEDLTEKELDNLFSFGGLGLVGGGALFLGSTMDINAEDIQNSNNGLTDLALGLGALVLAWKGRKGIKELTTRTKEQLRKVSEYRGMAKLDFATKEGFGFVGGTKWLHNQVKKLDSSSMPLTSSISKKLMDNLASIMNDTKGVLEPISSIKDDFVNGIKAKVYTDVGRAFEAHKEEIGFSSLNPLTHIKAREQFYEEIGKAYTTRNFDDLTQAQREAVTHFDKGFKEVLDGMKEAGVKGFENIKGFKHYFPRYHKAKMYDEVANMSKEDRELVLNWYSDSVKRGFKKAYGKDIDEDMAKKLAKQLLLYGKSDKIINQAKQDIFEELDLSDMNEYFGRAKFRIPLDFNIKPLEVAGKKLEMVDFMDTNAYSIFSRYSHVAGGHYAFAMHGYNSIPELVKEIKNEFVANGAGKKLQDTLLDYIDYLSGKPIIDDMNRSLINFSQLLSKATSAQLLHMSGLSTMSEVIPSIVTSIYNGNMGEAWKSFVKSSREPLERLHIDSVTDELITTLGYGEKRILSRETFKNSRPYTGEDIGLQGDLATKIDRLLTAQQKVTFFLNQLPALEDFANVLNVKSSFQSLMKHLKGEKVFNARRMETLGLNAEREKILNDMLNNGKLKEDSLNSHKWSREEIGAFKTVMTQIQRAKVGESVLGDTPRFIMKNPLYKSLITLLSFPIQSFDNMLLRDLYARDAESIMRFKLMLVGNMLGIQLKDTINKNERKGDKSLMERAIMHMPHTALLDIGASIFGKGRKTTLGHIFPAIGVLENALSVPQSALNLAIGDGKRKDTKVLLQALSVPLALGKVLAEEPKKPKGLGGLYSMSATISEVK